MVGVETTIVSEGTSSQKDKCTVFFFSFVEVSFESLDKHVLFRRSMVVRKVVRSDREGVVSRREDAMQEYKVNNRRRRVKWDRAKWDRWRRQHPGKKLTLKTF